ncbi:hypothetical protein [Aeoliella sp. SH292]|uniref:hypothetical protein n=1 Tax=Aeoliella sp. SH292 TaxID=3454464 RepID=UPI003F9DCA60
MSENPFQAPLTDAKDYATTVMQGGRQQAYVDGSYLVVRSGVVLPTRCVKTNQPTSPSEERRQTLYWAPSWIGILILVNLLILAIVYFVVRKGCDITYSESQELRATRRFRVLIASLACAGLFVGLIAGIVVESTVVVVVTILGILVGLITLLIVARAPVRPVKYKKGEFWIRGFSREYLDQLVVEGA